MANFKCRLTASHSRRWDIRLLRNARLNSKSVPLSVSFHGNRLGSVHLHSTISPQAQQSCPALVLQAPLIREATPPGTYFRPVWTMGEKYCQKVRTAPALIRLRACALAAPFKPDITVHALFHGPEVEGKCRGACRALLNAGSSCRCRRPRLVQRPSKAAMSASAVYVLDLKGKVLKGSPASALPGNQWALALSGPTLLLGNWPTSPARASGRRGSLTCQPCPVARKWAVVFFPRVPPHC